MTIKIDANREKLNCVNSGPDGFFGVDRYVKFMEFTALPFSQKISMQFFWNSPDLFYVLAQASRNIVSNLALQNN